MSELKQYLTRKTICWGNKLMIRTAVSFNPVKIQKIAKGVFLNKASACSASSSLVLHSERVSSWTRSAKEKNKMSQDTYTGSKAE